MLQIAIVLVANGFHQFSVGQQTDLLGDRPWLGVGLGIIDRDLNFHVPKVFPPETFDHTQRFRCRLAGLIQPRFSVEASGVDDERIAVPLACRITEPRGRSILGELTAIKKDLPPKRMGLVDEDYESWCLHKFPRWRRRIDPRYTLGQTVRGRIFF